VSPKYRIDYEHLAEIIDEQRLHEPRMDWEEGDPRPPWKPDRDKRYLQKITDWTNWHLDRTPETDWKPNYKTHFEWLKNDGPEIAAAERGNVEPLRKKYPHLAKFLHRAKRERHKRGPSLPWDAHDPAKFAAIEVEEIKAIWKHHYNREKRRFKPTAVEIAADRWNVSVADVKRWIAYLNAKK
jgi:hypothetical protein